MTYNYLLVSKNTVYYILLQLDTTVIINLLTKIVLKLFYKVIVLIEQYLKWIDQFKQVLDKWCSFRLTGEYDLIIVNGMGGSGVIGDYLYSLTSVYNGLPVVVFKNHVVPKYIDDDKIVLIISYSGNTVETIKFAEKVFDLTKNIVIVTSGGYLEKFALKNKLMLIKIPSGFLPRTSLPYMLLSILALMDCSGYTIVPYVDVSNTVIFLEKELENIIDKSRFIANHIHKHSRTLLLTTHSPLEPLVIRAKNEFSENAKIISRIDIVPESMHNDIVGWENPYSCEYVSLLIRDPEDHVGSKLVDFIEDIYREKNIPHIHLDLEGGSFFAKLMYGSLVIGLTSVFLAELRGVDPVRTVSIERYKSVVNKIYSEN